MAHLVETMVSGNNILPWHKLGTVVAGAMTAEEALRLSGQDWRVKKVPIWAPGFDYDPDDDLAVPQLTMSPRDYAIVRSSDNRILGTVGPKYHPLQNEEAFRFFDAFATKGEAIYETAGVLDGGRVAWILARLPQDIILRREGREDRDVSGRYVLLWNSFDGRSGVSAKLTYVRVVCANTLHQAIKGRGISKAIPHTASVQQQVAEMAQEMGLYAKRSLEFQEAAQAMMDREVKEAQVMDFLRRCWDSGYNFQNPASEAAQIEDAAMGQRLPRAIAESRRLFEEGAGVELAGGTVWGLYNAVTEFADHHAKYRTDNGRFRNALLEGENYNAKLRAWENALALIKA